MGMPWYKHKTNTLNDPRVEAFIYDHGCKAYALWCGFMEVICAYGDQIEKKQGSKKGLTWESSFNPKALANRLCLDDIAEAESILKSMFDAFKVELLSEGTVWQIRFLDIIILRDDYTRKKKTPKVLEQCQNNVRQDKEEDKDTDLEEKLEGKKDTEENKDLEEHLEIHPDTGELYNPETGEIKF